MYFPETGEGLEGGRGGRLDKASWTSVPARARICFEILWMLDLPNAFSFSTRKVLSTPTTHKMFASGATWF